MTTYTIETITAAQALAFSASDTLLVSNPAATATLSYVTPAADWTYDPVAPGAAILVLTPGLSNNVQFGPGLLGKTLVFQDNTILYIGTLGADYFVGGGLNDNLAGNAGADTLMGGAGDDQLDGRGGDNLFEGGPGNDTIAGGGGIDTATYVNSPGPVMIDLAHDRMSGSAGVDHLVGVEKLIGSTFNDSLTGDNSNNILVGGTGDDTLEGWSFYGDTDTISGGEGNDWLSNGSLITGEAGNDTISIASSTPNDVHYCYGGVGNDEIRTGQGGIVFGEDGADSLSSSQGDAVLDGGLGNDSLIAGGGHNTVSGGSGNDTIADAGWVNIGGDNLSGGAGNDSITVSGGGDTVNGGDGDDTIRADLTLLSQGYVQGGTAYDLVGGAGSDTFIGGPSGVARILDWEVSDRLSLGNAPTTSYVEATKATADEALQYARTQIASGVNYIAVAVGPDVQVFTDTYNTNDPAFTNKAVIVGRGLNDFSASNIVGGSNADPQAPTQPSPPTASGSAHATIRGNMDTQHLSVLLGASISGSSTSLVLQNPGVQLSLSGTGFTYDSNDQLIGGSVSNLNYTSSSFTFNVQTSGLSAAPFLSWVVNDATQTAFATILAGNDEITGSGGNDVLRGYAGADVFKATLGADRIQDFNLAQGDRIVLDAGVTYTVAQSGADAVVSLSNGGQITLSNVPTSALTGDWITGAGGATFETMTPAAALAIQASDTLTFGTGTATLVSVGYGADSITITMGGHSTAFGSAISDVSKAGHISMPDGSKLYIGGSTAETFTGAATGDAAFGGQGDDTLDGGAGGDLLQGNQGADRLTGGEGNDTVYGGQDADTLILGAGANFGQGNKGADVISGGAGADLLLGGQDNDTIDGDAGADVLNGNRGDDSLAGGAGNDTLYGESGADTLSGGAGADVFHGFSDGGLDRVVDFSRAEGDRVVLDAGTAYTASQDGADTVVTYGANQIVLVGVSLASLSGDWIGV